MWCAFMLSFKLKRRSIWLILIMILAFLVRLWGINFGFPFILHPDETKIVEPALTIAFDIRNTSLWNPHFFFYPHFLMYFLVIVIRVLKVLLYPFGIFGSFQKDFFYFIARFTTVLFGTLSVYLTYLVGKRLAPKGWESRIGLLSAFLLSVAYLHVRNSHYYTGDVPATFFMLLSFYLFLSGTIPDRDYPGSGQSLFKVVLAGVFCGVGISTKYYPALLLAIYIPLLIYNYRKDIKKLLLYCSIVIVASVFGFIMFTPYALLDHTLFIKTIQESSLRSSSGFMGASSYSPFYYLYNGDLSIDESFSGNSLAEGLGWVFIIFSVLGGVLAFRDILNKRDKLSGESYVGLIIIMLTVVLYYVFFSRYPTKLVRWLVCITPFLAILASYAIARLYDRRRAPILVVLAVFVAVVVFGNLYKSVRFDYALSRGDTRVAAYEYIMDKVPKGTPMVFESILIHKMVEDGDYHLFQITHDRYNTKGEIEDDYPPNLDGFVKASRAKYIIINGWSRQKCFNPSAYTSFPQVSKAWRDFYEEMDSKYPIEVSFNPYSQLLSGPPITIYKVMESN